MTTATPLVIPRNHLVERAAARAVDGDFAEFHRLLKAVQTPFEKPDEPAYCQPQSVG